MPCWNPPKGKNPRQVCFPRRRAVNGERRQRQVGLFETFLGWEEMKISLISFFPIKRMTCSRPHLSSRHLKIKSRGKKIGNLLRSITLPYHDLQDDHSCHQVFFRGTKMLVKEVMSSSGPRLYGSPSAKAANTGSRCHMNGPPTFSSH